MRLLLVEDNRRLAGLVTEGLADEGFVIDWSPTLAEAREMVQLSAHDLALLDLGMPDGDGIDFIRFLRRVRFVSPILVLTARAGLDDRVLGLDSGADDYLVKPFEMRELAARCRTLLRRPGAPLGTVLTAGNLRFDCALREAAVDGRPLRLSPKELGLLESLMRRAGHVVAKPSLESALYAQAAEVSANALEAVVSRLRRRLADSRATVTIHTAHGIGYILTPTRGEAG